MIFENERNIPCVNDWIGFFGCMVECLRQQLEREKHALSHYFLLDGFAWE